MHQIVLIDDHGMIRRGLAAYLLSLGRFSIAGEAGSLAEAYALIAGLDAAPDLILLDISLGEEDGLEVLSYLRKKFPHKKRRPATLVYSVFEDPFRLHTALGSGAQGYVSKSAGDEEIAAAIDAVLAGEQYIDRRLEALASETKDVFSCLTAREREILSLIQKNYDNRRISSALNLEIRTVESYVTRLYAKTGSLSRGELALF